MDQGSSSSSNTSALVALSTSDMLDILAGLYEQDHWWGCTQERESLRQRLRAAVVALDPSLVDTVTPVHPATAADSESASTFVPFAGCQERY